MTESEIRPPTPAAEGSKLMSLRDRRKAVESKLYTDLAVERYDPPVFVRFGPISQARMTAIAKAERGDKSPDAAVNSFIRVIVECCKGVYVLDEKGDKVAPDGLGGDWPKFDDVLADLLEVEPGRASTVVRALYATDGDISKTAQQIMRWTGFTAEEMAEATQGE